MTGGSGAPRLRAPEPIRADYRLDGFGCGKEPLDDWLKLHAVENEGRASRTFVVADADDRVLAYYTLASGSVTLKDVPRRFRQRLPNPVPVMLLGRLAVDRTAQGRGLGPAMLREAMTRTLRIAREAGVLALIVHAIDDEAVSFYARYRFRIFPPETRTLFLPVAAISGAVA